MWHRLCLNEREKRSFSILNFIIIGTIPYRNILLASDCLNGFSWQFHVCPQQGMNGSWHSLSSKCNGNYSENLDLSNRVVRGWKCRTQVRITKKENPPWLFWRSLVFSSLVLSKPKWSLRSQTNTLWQIMEHDIDYFWFNIKDCSKTERATRTARLLLYLPEFSKRSAQ